MKTTKEKLLEKIENLSEKDFLDFILYWIGEERLMELVEESLENYSDNDKDLKLELKKLQ